MDAVHTSILPWQRRERIIFAALLLLTPLCLFAGLLWGSQPLSPDQLWRPDPLSRDILWTLRLPRVLTAFAVGGLLALAGAILQTLLRNPLADPYILGLSGGAALASLLAMLLGAAAPWQPMAGFLGALGTALILFTLARSPQLLPEHLLLNGVMLAAALGAALALLLSISPDAQLRGVLFWLMGDLSQSNAWPPALAMLAIGLAVALPLARGLELLNLGERHASALGLPVTALRWGLFALTAALTATAVAVAGSVGFIGLLVPHLLRVLDISSQRWLLAGAVLLGGDLLILADTLSRSIASPLQLPVGAVTALLGAPLFLYLLHRQRQ